jgi:hypothetical protein
MRIILEFLVVETATHWVPNVGRHPPKGLVMPIYLVVKLK